MHTLGCHLLLLPLLFPQIAASPFYIPGFLGISIHPDPRWQGLIEALTGCRKCSRSTETGVTARFLLPAANTSTPPLLPCCAGGAVPGGPTAPPAQCKCGVEGSSRIVGGSLTSAGKYPWLGLLNYFSTDGLNPGGCACTLVAAQWAVTAAHCIRRFPGFPEWGRNNMSVVFGEYYIGPGGIGDGADTKRTNVRLVMDPIVHEDFWNPKPFSNDIALLKLETVDLRDFSPACLPTLNMDYTGRIGQVYGWGSTLSCPVTLSPYLREVSLSIVSDTVCQAASSDSILIPIITEDGQPQCVTISDSYSALLSPDMVCAGASGKGSCWGDSGGPLTVSDGQHYLAGVVSWGAGCATEGLYTVFADVASQRSWIDSKIASNGGATYC